MNDSMLTNLTLETFFLTQPHSLYSNVTQFRGCKLSQRYILEQFRLWNFKLATQNQLALCMKINKMKGVFANFRNWLSDGPHSLYSNVTQFRGCKLSQRYILEQFRLWNFKLATQNQLALCMKINKMKGVFANFRNWLSDGPHSLYSNVTQFRGCQLSQRYILEEFCLWNFKFQQPRLVRFLQENK